MNVYQKLSYFPIKIRLEGYNDEILVRKPVDLPEGKKFVVVAVKVKE